MRPALLSHWPEYVMEAAGLALFMISAGLFGTLLGDPESPAPQAVASPLLRRAPIARRLLACPELFVRCHRSE